MFDDVDAAPGGAPLQGMQAGAEFAQVEGLEQVVVGAGLQPGDPVGHRVARGQHQHRQVDALLAQALQQAQAVLVGQAEIEDQHVEARHLEQRLGIGGAGHPVHGQALGVEAGDDAAGDQVVVFGEQYMHGGIAG